MDKELEETLVDVLINEETTCKPSEGLPEGLPEEPVVKMNWIVCVEVSCVLCAPMILTILWKAGVF